MIDFSYSDAQQRAGQLAEEIFAGYSGSDRLRSVEDGEPGYDEALWGRLMSSGLMAMWISRDLGGSGGGLMELCAAAVVYGRHVTQVPFVAASVGALAVDRLTIPAELRCALVTGASSGRVVLVPALPEPVPGLPDAPDCQAGRGAGADAAISGRKVSVSGAALATHFLVPARSGGGTGLFLVGRDAPGLSITAVRTTNREVHGHLDLDGTPGTPLGDASAARALQQTYTVAQCAVQAGVCERAAELTADYTSQREQFGRSLAGFQAVLMRGADMYIDLLAMRVAMWKAAWDLAAGSDAELSAATAKWWASEAGNRVIHNAMYLHGAVGNELTYPLHRYYLWGKQIDASFGAAAEHLERVGGNLAR